MLMVKRIIINDGVEASTMKSQTSFPIRLISLKTTLRFPCFGLNPIIVSVNINADILFSKTSDITCKMYELLIRLLYPFAYSIINHDIGTSHFIIRLDWGRIHFHYDSQIFTTLPASPEFFNLSSSK